MAKNEQSFFRNPVLWSLSFLLILICYFSPALINHRATANPLPLNFSPFSLHQWSAPCQQRIAFEKQYLLTQQDKLQARVASSQDDILYIGGMLKKFKLPGWIIWLPLLESGYRSNAVSNAGAAGLWQLMPDTARRFGLTVSVGQDDRFDIEKSTTAALKYLSWLYTNFGKDWSLALAGYNAGELRVSKAQQKAKLMDYCDLQLPVETQRYVPRLIAMAEILAQMPSTLPTGNVPFLFHPKTVDLTSYGSVIHLEKAEDAWLLLKETPEDQVHVIDLNRHIMISSGSSALIPELINQTTSSAGSSTGLPVNKKRKSAKSVSK